MFAFLESQAIACGQLALQEQFVLFRYVAGVILPLNYSCLAVCKNCFPIDIVNIIRGQGLISEVRDVKFNFSGPRCQHFKNLP